MWQLSSIHLQIGTRAVPGSDNAKADGHSSDYIYDDCRGRRDCGGAEVHLSRVLAATVGLRRYNKSNAGRLFATASVRTRSTTPFQSPG